MHSINRSFAEQILNINIRDFYTFRSSTEISDENDIAPSYIALVIINNIHNIGIHTFNELKTFLWGIHRKYPEENILGTNIYRSYKYVSQGENRTRNICVAGGLSLAAPPRSSKRLTIDNAETTEWSELIS